jgi:His Kinase A (phospho-acceptor) domain/GAF domain
MSALHTRGTVVAFVAASLTHRLSPLAPAAMGTTPTPSMDIEIRPHRAPRVRTAEIPIADRPRHAGPLTAESVGARESIALRRIAANTGEEPYAVLQGLLSAAVELCGGGADTSTAGVSLLEPAPDGGEQFRWVALAGCLASHIGGTTPRNFSPCGECLDRGGSVILSRPDMKYDYFRSTGLEFTEGLVLPFITELQPNALGTIWVVSHPPRRHHFDADDVRLMESVGHFAASAYSLAVARDKADGTKREHQDAVATVSHEMRTPLNTIAASVYLLTLETNGTLTEGQLEHLARIQTAVKLLLTGVDGLSESAQSVG